MRYRRFFILLALVFLAISISGCGSGKSEISASIGQEFTLPVGKTAAVSGQELFIKFMSVETESRCPKGVMCIRAGEAKCTLQMTLQGSKSTVTFIDQAGMDGYSQTDFNRFRFSFKLMPYPEAGHTIAAGDYRLVMTVSQ
jgi:hypothetical protein